MNTYIPRDTQQKTKKCTATVRVGFLFKIRVAQM